jgi:hypothetical protein
MTFQSYPFSCIQCRKKTRFNGIMTLEWHAFCTRKSCPFGAWTGTSQDLAEQAANRHARNAANHAASVQVEFMTNPAAAEKLRKLKELNLL